MGPGEDEADVPKIGTINGYPVRSYCYFSLSFVVSDSYSKRYGCIYGVS